MCVVYWHHKESKERCKTNVGTKNHFDQLFEYSVHQVLGQSRRTLRIPLNNSISMNLDHAVTTTTVSFASALNDDEIVIAGKTASDAPRARDRAP